MISTAGTLTLSSIYPLFLSHGSLKSTKTYYSTTSTFNLTELLLNIDYLLSFLKWYLLSIILLS